VIYKYDLRYFAEQSAKEVVAKAESQRARFTRSDRSELVRRLRQEIEYHIERYQEKES